MRGAFSTSTLGGTATHCLGFTKLQKNSRVAGPSDRTHAVIDFLRGSTPVGKPGGHSAALHLKLRSSDSGRSWRGTSKLNYDLTETPGPDVVLQQFGSRFDGKVGRNWYYALIIWLIFIVVYERINFYQPWNLVLKEVGVEYRDRIDLRWRR